MRQSDQARELIKAALVLALIEYVSFGLFSSKMGFYHDDWAILERLSLGGSFWGSVRALASAGYWVRPVEIVQFPIFFAVGGFNPVAHQFLLMFFDALGGVLLFILLKGLWGRGDLALAAAALALIYPNHGTTHHWFANSPQLVAVDLALASMIFQRRWLDSGRTAMLFAAMSCYLLSILCYESTAFLPLLLAGSLAPARAGKAMLPYGLALSVGLLWQWVGAPLLMDAANPKTPGVSLSHAWDVFKAGFQCVTTRAVWFCSLTARYAIADFGRGLTFVWAAFTLAAALLLKPAEEAAPRDARRLPATALRGAAACFVGAYAPYALSAAYVPAIIGVINRVNAGAGLAGGLLCAALIEGVGAWAPAGYKRSARAAQGVLLAVLVGAFTWTNWEVSLQWNRSWAAQNDILTKLQRHVETLPGPATIFLTGAPVYVNGIPVFAANWDFDAALRLRANRRDLRGDILSSQIKMSDYVRPHIYHYDTDRLQAVKP